ncbi:GNAT family N-acetyltransferase [Pradoshia eiseniae]|uniref:GNAT family N-acetyltransferase n=1 Tax=Pradoshia eiseniae TaxID=2064768 RepID=UPI0022AA37A3|nr:GNAT family protein [Pradoshia eiseniae]
MKPFKEDAFPLLMKWIESEEQVTLWSGSTFTFPLTEKQLIAYQADKSQIAFSAFSNETGECIGHIAIGRINNRHQSARIGKVLIGDPAMRGKGFGEEMVREAVRFAFQHLRVHKITLGVYEQNARAIACYERIGFKKEGLLKDHARVGDGYWNMWEMGLLEV